MVNYYAGSLILPAPGRQISGPPPASGSRTALTRIPPCHLFLVTSSLSLHLARFLSRPDGCSHFRFRGLVGLTMGLAIGGAVLMAEEVAVGLSGWSLWNKLMNFLRCWTTKTDSQVFFSSGYSFQKTR